MPSEPRWLDLEKVLAAHDTQIALFGGSAGVRDVGLIEGALPGRSSFISTREKATY